MRPTFFQQRFATFAIGLLILAAAGCPAESSDNPSGTCGTKAPEARPGYDAPGDVTWVPDCQLALRREYWRVYTEDGKTAFVLPRPDGAEQLQAVCQDPAHALRPLVERYLLCTVATDSEQVEVINHIDVTDALALTHYLHGQLRFATTATGVGITPYPIPGDVLDACAIETNPPELETICGETRALLQSGWTIAQHYTGVGAAQLAARLNTLYGVP